MTDKEQRAHDIAVAAASCLEQAKQNAKIAANLKLGNPEIPIIIDPAEFIRAYNDVYEKALTSLKQ